MSTPFSDIYDIFLSKITDYDLAGMDDVTMEDHLERWLKNSIPQFPECRSDLSCDYTSKTFTADLTAIEQQILAQLMVVEWLSPRLKTTQLLKQYLPDKDYKINSQAQHIKELKDLSDDAQERADGMIMKYTYQVDIEDLK
jgi:hypothetical protein